MSQEVKDGDRVKMVLVVRDKFTDAQGRVFGIRKGKVAVQACHAATQFLLEKLRHPQNPRLCGSHAWTPVEQEWLDTGQTKICCLVETEELLLEVYARAKEAHLVTHLITDAASTELKEPTRTCLAIGPARSSDVDRITGHLRLA